MASVTTTTVAVPTDRPSFDRRKAWIAFAVAPLLLLVTWVPISERLMKGFPAGIREQTHFATWSASILLLLLCVATVTDLRWRKIPNWATYPTFLWGLTINAIATFAGPERSIEWIGAVGLGDSLAGGFGLLALMFLIFSLTGGGAGDVKLAACIGALLGFQVGFNAVLYSFVVGGAGTLVIIIMRCGPINFVTELYRTLGCLLGLKVKSPTGVVRQVLKRKVPLAPFFAAGVIIALFQEPLAVLLD